MRDYSTEYNIPNKVKMFSYGMNTNLVSMRLRCSYAKVIGNATLNHHQLEFRYHLDLTPMQEDCQVEGVLWEIDASDLQAIDEAESYPNYYIRQEHFVRTNRNVYKAWIYTMNSNAPLQEPDTRYLKHVLEGYWQNNLSTQQLYDALERAKETVMV